MTRLGADLDVVAVGADATGIAAAVLEARDRVGGRAWTVELEGHPAELGCGWLHSADRDRWVAVAAGLGLPLDRVLADRGADFARARQLSPRQAAAREWAFARFWSAVDRAAPPDRPLAALLPLTTRGCRTSPP